MADPRVPERETHATKETKEADPEGGRVLIRFNEEDVSQVNFSNLTQIVVNGQPGSVFYKHPTPDHGLAIITFFGDDLAVVSAEPLPGEEEAKAEAKKAEEERAAWEKENNMTPQEREREREKVAAKR